MKRSSWLDVLTEQAGLAALAPAARRFLANLDDVLFAAWNLGDNLVLAWTRDGDELRFLHVRHYAIIEQIESKAMNAILVGERLKTRERFAALSQGFGGAAQIITMSAAGVELPDDRLVENLVSRYSVSLVRERAVLLLDAVGFSLREPLEQVAMLNSLSYSINSAHSQLLSEHVHINFARTTTGDGFYIWNRARSMVANLALYQLMMLILADNAVAASKAKRFPVPQLRAAFHIGEHYEFYQVEGLNPSSFGYIVGEVTISLARMVEQARPGQILLGDFVTEWRDNRTGEMHAGTTPEFVEKTASAMDGLKGALVGEDQVKQIRCYLTGERQPDGRFAIARREIRDKHGQVHAAYNAKMNIHREHSPPIFLGLQHKDLR
jgi:class 3 adenylate cyclase